MKILLSTSAPNKSKGFKVTLPKVRKANKEFSVEFGTLAKLAKDGVDIESILIKPANIRFLINIGNFIFGRGAEYSNGSDLALQIINTAIEKRIADPKLFNAQDYARLTGTKLKPTVLKKFSAVECKKIQDKLAKELKKGYDLSYDLRGFNSSVTLSDANQYQTKTRYIELSPKLKAVRGERSERPEMNRVFYGQATRVSIYLLSDRVRVDYTLFGKSRGSSTVIKSVNYKVDEATYKSVNKFVNLLVGKIRMVKAKRTL